MDILERPILQADHRIAYGPDPQQFGDLWMPGRTSSSQSIPTVVFFHGGWWRSEYDLGYAGFLCSALKQQGIAVWSVEYRRVGADGGGWPTTFQDAAAGLAYLTAIARTHPIDLTRVITMGHSAGGHLAFWLAGQHHLDPHSPLYSPPSVALCGALALAGAVDLRLTIDLSGFFLFAHDRQEVLALMGGSPHDQPERYREGNPGDLLPFNIPQVLIQGTEDTQIPAALPKRWAELAGRMGDSVDVMMLPGATHFDVVDPTSHGWPAVLAATRKLLAPPR